MGSLTVFPLPRVISTHRTVLPEVTSLLDTFLLGKHQGSNLTRGSPTWPKRPFEIPPSTQLHKGQKDYCWLLLSTDPLHPASCPVQSLWPHRCGDFRTHAPGLTVHLPTWLIPRHWVTHDITEGGLYLKGVYLSKTLLTVTRHYSGTEPPTG